MTNSDSDLRVALVTGAGRGIGLATATALRDTGFRVLALDRDFGAGSLTESATLQHLTYDLEDLAGIAPLVS